MRDTNHYDVIVIGVGGMGSAAVYHLARRGKRVFGLERYDIPHQMGSSHGITRIIRPAYYEHPSSAKSWPTSLSGRRPDTTPPCFAWIGLSKSKFPRDL